MRLINTTTLQLVEHVSDIPEYAVLSHTWGNEEISFQDWNRIQRLDWPRRTSLTFKDAFQKVTTFCRLCQDAGYDWAWVDTCCIDKSSSSELSEALNSMYAWYASSVACFAYLADVPTDDNVNAKGSEFRRSRWFTRGWTLQELVAPRRVDFFAADWTPLGSRKDLAATIEQVTRIPYGTASRIVPAAFSVATRMAWGACRETTRPEDAAYCMMGLFGVNMPLLYGEGGARAFCRLQQEIMKGSTDHSLFAWRLDPFPEEESFPHWSPRVDGSCFGFLAPRPACFKGSGAFDRQRTIMTKRGLISSPEMVVVKPYQMTNLGLQISLFLIPKRELPWFHRSCEDNCHLAFLNCYLDGTIDSTTYPQLAVHLRPHPSGNNVFERVCCRSIELVRWDTLKASFSKKRLPGQVVEVYISPGTN